MLRKIAAGWSRLRPWKKKALAAILILMVLSRGLALARRIQGNRLVDQNEGKRWAADGSAAQISCFFSEDAGLTQDSIPELEYNLLHGLEAASVTSASLGLPEAVPLLEDCWSASGKIEISHNGTTVSCGAVGTGGAYFLFHPLRLLDGDYYRPEEIMKDRVMLDEETAWALFGSSDIEGQIIEIGDVPHYVAGVYKRDQDPVSRAAGLNGRCVYVSLETLQAHGSGGFRDEGSADTPGEAEVRDQQPAADAETAEAGGSSVLESAESKESAGLLIDCYEVVMPNPVTGFAEKIVSSQLGTDPSLVTVVDNSRRFSGESLRLILAGWIRRGMQTVPMRYPFWENRARAWENIFALMFFLENMTRIFAGFLTILLVISWYRHRKWTAAAIVREIRDRNYDRQARRALEKKQKIQENIT